MQGNNGTPVAYTLTLRSKIIKGVYSGVLPVVYYLLCFYLGVSSIFWVLPLTFVVALLYAIPLFVNVSRIKNGDYISIKPFIVGDLLYSIAPSVGVAFIAALVIYLFVKGLELVFMFTIILTLLFVLVNLYFWLSYYVNNTIVKRIFNRKD